MIAKAGVALLALTFAASTLERIAGTMGLVAGIIVSFGIIFASGRQVWKFVRRLESVVENTSALPEFMREQRATNARVHERQDKGDQRLERIEAALDTWAVAERAAVDAAITASTTSRSPRKTDPQ